MIALRLCIILSFLFLTSQGRTIVIQKSSSEIKSFQTSVSEPKKTVKIAVVSSPDVIGKYAQSVFNVSLATLLSLRQEGFELKRYDMRDESHESLAQTFDKLRQDGIDAVVAPLTKEGTKNTLNIDVPFPLFIPTVHKREFPSAPDNFIFGGIDYNAQIEALLPYMGDFIAIFYDTSTVGSQLKSSTEEVFLAHKSEKKKVSAYAVDNKGDNIPNHLAKPSAFNKASIVLHIPVVKSAILASQLTFRGINERNILSTQMNRDPNLLLLTQYADRKNLIVANSLIEFPSRIYESNVLMNNDISFDWIQYSTSVGIDCLIALLDGTSREYTMRIIHSQVIYPVELLRAKEYGFESVRAQ